MWLPVLAVAIGLFVCFLPLSLKNSIDKADDVVLSVHTAEIQEGEPYIDMRTYNDLTWEQKTKIMDLLKTVSYTRTIGTLFGGGGIDDAQTYMNLYLYSENKPVTVVCLTETGKISIDNKIYQMKTGIQIMEQITKVCNLQ